MPLIRHQKLVLIGPSNNKMPHKPVKGWWPDSPEVNSERIVLYRTH
jgi:hypothetical protein